MAIPSLTARAGRLDLALDFLRFWSVPTIVVPTALGVFGETPALVGITRLPPLEQLVTDQVIRKQSLLGPAYTGLSTELLSKQSEFVSGYLSGGIGLGSALAQMDQVQRRIASDALASAGLS